MTVINPNAKIASCWNGALQLRLRHAPLEEFLRGCGQKWTLSGDNRITDNLACATTYIVGEPLAAGEGRRPIAPPQHPVVGQIACGVSASLAVLIQEPLYWRTAALVGTARLLERYVGLSAAAHAAAAAAREYNRVMSTGSPDGDILEIGRVVHDAVTRNDAAELESARRLIAACLDKAAPRLAAGGSGAPATKPALVFALGQ